MPKLTSQAAIIGFGRLLTIAAASATLMVLARVMPDYERYGAICQLILIYMVFSQIAAAGLPHSLYYFLPRYAGGERRAFLTQTIALLMFSGLALGAGLFFCANLLGTILKSPLLPPLLQIFALYPFFTLPTMAVESVMLHHNRPIYSVIFNIAGRVGMFCSLVIPSLLGADLDVVVWAWVGMAVIMWVIALVLMLSSVHGLPLIWNREMFRDEMRFSIPLAITTLFALAAVYLDRFLVSNLYGSGRFGIYNNATIIIPSLGMVANAGSAVLMAEVSKRTSAGDFTSFLPIWHNAMMKAAVILFSAQGFLFFWKNETMHVLFSHRFAESAEIFAIYVWIIPASMFIIQSIFVAMGATRMYLIVPIVGLVLQVISISVCWYWLGFIGIAVGAVVGRYLGIFVASYLFVNKLTTIGWKRFMPWIKLLVSMLTALSAGALSRLLLYTPIRELPLLMIFGIGLLVYLGLYVLGMHFVRLLNYLVPVRYLPARWYPRPEVKV